MIRMNCDRSRPKLALLVGNDLDPREASEVRLHLATCAQCQSQFDSLAAATGVLHSLACCPALAEEQSLWSRVAPLLVNKLSKKDSLHRKTPVNVNCKTDAEAAPSWLTIAGFSVACAAVLWLTFSTPVFDFDIPAGTGYANVPDSVVPNSVPLAVSPGSSQVPRLMTVGENGPTETVELTADGVWVPVVRPMLPPSSFGEPRSF